MDYQWRSQPKNLEGTKFFLAKMFDFRRITLFCLERRLSKTKWPYFLKSLGAWPLWPTLATPVWTTALLNCKQLCLHVNVSSEYTFEQHWIRANTEKNAFPAEKNVCDGQKLCAFIEIPGLLRLCDRGSCGINCSS